MTAASLALRNLWPHGRHSDHTRVLGPTNHATMPPNGSKLSGERSLISVGPPPVDCVADDGFPTPPSPRPPCELGPVPASVRQSIEVPPGLRSILQVLEPVGHGQPASRGRALPVCTPAAQLEEASRCGHDSGPCGFRRSSLAAFFQRNISALTAITWQLS